jgi:uncharacterized protein YndB with AHSA1/START domain
VNDATLITGGPRPAVRLERRLPDPPEVVWQALTQREQLRAWFPSDVSGEWRVGAPLRFEFPPEVTDMTLTGEVLEVDPPRRLAFTWGEETLRFELSPDGDGTKLVLTDELPAAHAARNAAGWDTCLDRLAGRDGEAWQPRFDRYAAAFAPALGPQEGPPSGDQGGAPERPALRR